MVNLDWRVESRAGVSLVELTVENPTGVARRVRVRNCLDGVVWPPRREGVPEAGWDDGGFEGVVASGDSLALGYASPASPTDSQAESPADPPVELVWSERAGASERDDCAEWANRAERDAPTDGDDCGAFPANGDDPFPDEATPEGVVRALGDPRPPSDAVPRPVTETERTATSGSRRSP